MDGSGFEVVTGAAQLPSTARVLLLAVVGVLLVALGVLCARVGMLRRPRRAKAHEPRPQEAPPRPLAGRAVGCPNCRRSFHGTFRYCPHDASELVPAGLLAARVGAGGEGEGE